MNVMERADARAELREDVALMRELGVARWGEIVLGPIAGQPAKELSPEEMRERIQASAQAQQDVLFAASGIRPRIPMRSGRGNDR